MKVNGSFEIGGGGGGGPRGKKGAASRLKFLYFHAFFGKKIVQIVGWRPPL